MDMVARTLPDKRLNRNSLVELWIKSLVFQLQSQIFLYERVGRPPPQNRKNFLFYLVNVVNVVNMVNLEQPASDANLVTLALRCALKGSFDHHLKIEKFLVLPGQPGQPGHLVHVAHRRVGNFFGRPIAPG
jgi:hypothetical protein